MTTNPEEFRLFHRLLTKGRPTYQPFYIVLRSGGKVPLGERGSWKGAGVSFEEAKKWMAKGFNIGLAGTGDDGLVIIDEDKEGTFNDAKPTLTVRTRRRTGRHRFYFTEDRNCKTNITVNDPNDKNESLGELRTSWQYVVVAGAFVTTDTKELKVQPPEDQLPFIGAYTLDNDLPVATITFDELPLAIRQVAVDQDAQQPPQHEPKRKRTEGSQSKLWQVTVEGVVGQFPSGAFPSPFHGCEGKGNTTVSEDGAVLHCWRHKVSLTALEALVVKAGLMDCSVAGKGHRNSSAGPSKIDWKDKGFVLKVWEYAKKNGVVPEDDPNPFGEERPKKKHKGEKDEEEAKPQTALRMVGTKVYRQVVDATGKTTFAVYDQATQESSTAEVIPETKEIPTQGLKGVTFPRCLAPYGSPLQLYQRLKARMKYVSCQTAHKNAVFCLWLMYHGSIPPRKRHNLQVIPMGPAGTGKGRYVEMAKYLGDRARVTTDPTLATSYRLNAMLNGGLDILDEMPDDAEHIEAYVRGRYDPFTVQQRILDPHSTTDIAGFEIAGPTLITRRRPFHDDANTDRGIIIRCEKPTRLVPTEIIKHEPDLDLQDQLAMFWSEHYNDEVNLLPTEEELMYDGGVGGDTIDCRLFVAATYLKKLAGLLGEEAVLDIAGFVDDQDIMRKELKASTEDGLMLGALYDILTTCSEGYVHVIESRDGSTRTEVTDTLAVVPDAGNRFIVAITRTPTDEPTDEKRTKLVPINRALIKRMAGLARHTEVGTIFIQYSIREEKPTWIKGQTVRTISFNLDLLDAAFHSFVPGYDKNWATAIKAAKAKQVGIDSFSPPTTPPDSAPPAPSTTPPMPTVDKSAEVSGSLHNLQETARNHPPKQSENLQNLQEEEQKTEDEPDKESGSLHNLHNLQNVEGHTVPEFSTTTEAKPIRGEKDRGGVPPTSVSCVSSVRNHSSAPTRPEKHSPAPTLPEPPAPKGEIGSDFVTLYRRCALQEPLKDWAIRRMVSTKASGDKFGPRDVRQEAPKAFSSMMNEIGALADYMFADVEKIADQIHKEKVDLDQAFQIMHQPREVPR